MNLSEDYRNELVTSGCSLTIDYANNELNELKYFVDTLEIFISNEECREVEVLAKYAQQQGITPAGEFWAEHPPYWWRQIFASRLRSSYTITLMSAVEKHLEAVCLDIQVILRSEIAQDELKGSTIERCRKYLEKVAKFQSPLPHTWEIIGYLYDVRNIFIHNGGMLGESVRSKRLNHFASIATGLSIQSGKYIELEHGFVDFAISIVKTFFSELSNELHLACERAQIATS